MPFAVELLLDGRAAEGVRRVWEALRAAGVSSSMLDVESRPHVSLAVYEDLDLDPFRTQVEAFFASETSVDVPIASVGTFRGNDSVVFCAPVVTPQLLGLHERFHKRFDHLAEGAWAYYRPGSWFPHCTLALDVAPHDRARCIDVALETGLPSRARLSGAMVVHFEPEVLRPSRSCFEATFGV